MVVLGGAVVLIVVSVASLRIGETLGNPGQRASARAAAARHFLTVPVEQERLTSVAVGSATVVAEHTTSISTPALTAATASDLLAVVTRLPIEVGGNVRAGSVIAEVSGRPIILVPGRFPAYRSMRTGDRGVDVAQLRSGLRALGYETSGDGPEFFGARTTRAVLDLYAHAGYTAMRSGPGLRVVVPRGELLFSTALPATVTDLARRVGDLADEAQSLGMMSSVRTQVKVRIATSDMPALRLGQPVVVSLKGVSARGAVADIISTSTATGTGESNQPSVAHFAVVRLPAIPSGWAGGQGVGTITTSQAREVGPVVPAIAVRSDGDRSWIQVLRQGSVDQLPVTVVFSARGRVQLAQSAGLRAGARVVVGSPTGGTS